MDENHKDGMMMQSKSEWVRLAGAQWQRQQNLLGYVKTEGQRYQGSILFLVAMGGGFGV
jgi:hypothetical protein